MPEWQPIKSAPKDGTTVRLKNALGQEAIAHWEHGADDWRPSHFGNVGGFPISNLLPWEPTHWAPLER